MFADKHNHINGIENFWNQSRDLHHFNCWPIANPTKHCENGGSSKNETLFYACPDLKFKIQS